MLRHRFIWVIAIIIPSFAFLSWALSLRVWDGGYLQAEFQFKFMDDQGKPLQGVQLQVKGDDGKAAYCYPVTDFQEGAALTSDENGMLVFHHVSMIPEFGGRYGYVFFCYPIGQY